MDNANVKNYISIKVFCVHVVLPTLCLRVQLLHYLKILCSCTKTLKYTFSFIYINILFILFPTVFFYFPNIFCSLKKIH